MSYPENPETIILRNKFYPKGLSEKDVYEYYQSVKGKILQQTQGRELMFAIMVDMNKPVIRRKVSGKFIFLTPSNYDKMITGRTLVIYSTMRFYETIAIVDIDADNFEQTKQPTIDVYNELQSSDFIRDLLLLFYFNPNFVFWKLKLY